MSICKVEGFYDSIKKYEKVADVIKRASLEVEYLNQVCGTTASLKRYFSMYRNYLKAKISAKHLLQDKPMLALLLSILKLNEKQQREFKGAHRAEISYGQSNLRKIYNVENYLNTAIGLLSAVSVYDRILGLAALTGRRPAEIACSAVLTRVADNKYAALFTGQLKTKNRTDIAAYEIPLLYDYDAIAKTLADVREGKPQFIDKPVLFNDLASSDLSARVKRRFAGLFEGEIKVKNLRAIYALLAFNQFKERVENGYVTISMNMFFSKILGHGEHDAVTCGSYIDFCCPLQKASDET